MLDHAPVFSEMDVVAVPRSDEPVEDVSLLAVATRVQESPEGPLVIEGPDERMGPALPLLEEERARSAVPDNSVHDPV
jgi:hypothetical protein